MNLPDWLHEALHDHRSWLEVKERTRSELRRRCGLNYYQARTMRQHLEDSAWDVGAALTARYVTERQRWKKDQEPPGGPAQEAEETDPVEGPMEAPGGSHAHEWYNAKRLGYFNERTRQYITWVPGMVNPLVLGEETHKALLVAYSNWDGAPATINEVCREFPMFNRQILVKYLRVWGVTHDSEPFTQEEIAHRDLDEMADEAFQLRRRSLYRKAKAKEWAETEKAAERWWAFEQEALMAIRDLTESATTVREVDPMNVPDPDEPYALLLGLTDFHFGMYAWEGETRDPYDLEEAYDRLDEYVDDVVGETVAAYGKPDEIILTAGSDFFHVDGDQATTTKGTPQDVAATPTQILMHGCDLNVYLVEKLLAVGCRLRIAVLMSNHGRANDLALLLYLSAKFEDHPQVEVIRTCEPRVYLTYGSSAICLHHGDQMKARHVVDCFAAEEPGVWGRAENRYVFAGHLHKTEVQEIGGAMCCLMPSLAGNDRFHTRRGYVTSRPGLSGYRITEERGIRSFLFSGVQRATGMISKKKVRRRRR